MALKRGCKVDRGYATVAEDEGDNYREIADMMTAMAEVDARDDQGNPIGQAMNHSSARNYVLRVMRKFATAFAGEYGIDVNEARIDEIAKSPRFQYGVADLLNSYEMERRTRKE